MRKGVQYIRDLLENLLVKSNKGSLKQRLIKGAAGTFGLRIAATGLNFITGILLARLLGASGFGIYTYAFTWTQLLTLGATLGLDKLIVREFAIYRTKSAWSLMRGLLHWANHLALAVSVGIVLGAIGIAWSLNMQANPEQFLTFCVAMLLIPIVTLRNLRLGAMGGLHKIVMGLVPEWIFAPLLLLVLTGFMYLFLGEGLSAIWVALIRVFAAVVTLVISVRLLHRILPNAAKEATPQYQAKTWLQSALPFMFMGSMFMIKSRTDIVMLGALQGAESVGIYFAVSRGVQLIKFILGSVNTVLAPNIADLYAEGKIKQLQRIITKSARVVLLIALPITAITIGFGYWYLLLFGEEFIKGKQALIILSESPHAFHSLSVVQGRGFIAPAALGMVSNLVNYLCLALSIIGVGQLVNATTGSVGLLLNMTGHERFTSITSVVGTGLNVILNALLIPRWGIEGAAFATTSTTILVNIMNTIWVRQQLGIHCTAFGKLI